MTIGPTNYSLQRVGGAIGTNPRLIDGDRRSREVLCPTLTVDHDVGDGTPATRFVHRLGERIEASYGFDTTSIE